MNSILLKVGQFSVYTLSFFVVLAFLWFGFVIYKKGSEYHYRDESLFDLTILAGVLAWVLARLGFVVTHWGVFSENWLRVILLSTYPGYSFFGLLVGVILADLLLSHQGELKTYEGLDLLALGLAAAGPIWQLGLVFSGHISFVWRLPKELLLALVFLLFFVWLLRLEREYRTFLWYRYRRTQAKSGFIFGAYLFLLGLVTVAASLVPKFISADLISGGLYMLSGGIFIYWRSGRVLSHDVKSLIKK